MRKLFFFALGLAVLLPLLAVMLLLMVATGVSAAQCGQVGGRGTGPVAGVPAADIPIFQGAAAQYGLGARGPSILAAINYVESDFGISSLPGVRSGTNRAGAAGPMQIGVGGQAGDTWDSIKVNAPGDPPGQAPNVYDEADAVYSAANYLQRSGAPSDWASAVFAYNHATVYVQQVLGQASSYYTQGLPTGGSSGSAGAPAPGPTQGRPLAVPPAQNDPAAPITLTQGQPQIVGATYFTGRTGAWGDKLIVNSDSYAELSPGIPGSAVTKQNATMLGGLPYMTPLQVTNPKNGRSVILYKRDIGAGQPLNNTLSGYHYRIDLTQGAEQQLGLSGSALVRVTLLNASAGSAFGNPTCGGLAPAGSGIDPIPGFTIGRDDMGVDGSAPVGTPIYAPFASQLVDIVPDWYSGQPLLLFKFLTPPPGALSDYWYVAEEITPATEAIGTTFSARQVVANFAPSGTGIEIGWGSPTSNARTLAGVTDPAAANPGPGALTVWAETFKQYFGIPGVGQSR